MLELFNFVGLSLLLLNAGTWAQSGYNYARPEISNIVGSTGAGTSNIVRPLIPLANNAITSPTNAAVGYPSSTGSGFSGTGVTGSAATSPFAGFGTQPTALSATGPTAYSAPTGGGFNAPKRPILTTTQQQRGGSGGGGATNIYGGGLTNIATGQSAYNSAGRVSGQNDIDYGGEGDYSAIPGVPAIDYPVYAQVPQTNFDCAQQIPGYYSDVEAQCQVFHICALNRTYSFLCPNGTIFSQETLVCVWWNQFQCSTAPALYANNAFIYDYGNEQRPATIYSSSSGTTQLGGRQQANNYAGNSGSTGVRSTSATLPNANGIFGAGNLRSTSFGSVPSTVTPVPSTTGYGAGTVTGAGRFSASSLSPNQAYNSAGSSIAPTQATYGPGSVGGGGAVVPASASPSTTNNNREYLPPPQQQRRP